VDNSAKASPAALREGSTLYYSLLFLEPKARECVANTLKLVSVISTTLYDVTEPQVAEKKIHWWHEELERLTKRSARHPACVTVQEYLHTPDAAKALLNVLSAAATERYTPPATEQSLNDMLISDYAARLSLIELSATHSNPVQNHELTAQALGKMHRLCTFSDRLQHGYSVLSDEYYKQFETAPEQLLNDQTAVTKLHSSIEQTSANRCGATHLYYDQTALCPVAALAEEKAGLGSRIPRTDTAA